MDLARLTTLSRPRPAGRTPSVPGLATVACAAWVLLAGLGGTPGAVAAESPRPPVIRVGIVGLDAHALPWIRILHDPAVKPPLSDLRVVAAVPSFSADIPFSRDSIATHTAELARWGVEAVDGMDTLLPKVDAVMILGIDGRPHLEQARKVFPTRKPLFVDKPVAASLADVVRLFREADASGTPCFSNSALRYGPATVAAASDPKVGRILGCDTFCSSQSILPGHPDLFYYGIHGCDLLFTLMGTGCRTVSRVKTGTADLVTGVWADGRVGTYRGLRQGAAGYGASVFGERGLTRAGQFEGYEPLLAEIARFFVTRRPPVTAESTLEIYAFLEAADESLRREGRPVALDEVLARARREAEGRGE